ncbi:MAG: hypothetical protein AAF654_13090 [Myxococcota bacterium]
MNQITVRGFGAELEKKLRELADRDGISLNRAALKLMRQGAGLSDANEGESGIGHALDSHFGTWSEEQEAEFLESTASTRVVDDEVWK